MANKETIRRETTRRDVTLLPVLGDQLTPALASLRGRDRAASVVLMAEVAEEAGYVRHHKQKLAFVFSAMRHYAERLRREGWTVRYVALDDPENAGSLTGELARAVADLSPARIVATEGGEWRVRAMQDSWETLFGVPAEVLADDRFLCSHRQFDRWADGRSDLLMEDFYRRMRVETGLLMDGDRPAGGRWNYDKQNRRPAERDLLMPRPLSFPPDGVTREVMETVERRFPGNPGTLDAFDYAVTAEDAERQAAAFLANALPDFGTYEDAMLAGERALWHSVLSPYLNAGLLDPMDLCRRAEAEYRAGRSPINSVEGYVRQVIGWREYLRGVYWREGPGYARRNFFEHDRPLPAFYWTADTDMACLREVVGQTMAHAHAHHIQRLMVTGNYALLIGVDPFQVHEWYLEVYLDAYEWVELPNTLGMSQYADGGLTGTKPYVSTGAYIDRMSDYCRGCRYDVKQRVGPDACPFNALYWAFLDRHRDRLGRNRRLAQPYRAWDAASEADREAVRGAAAAHLASLDAAPPAD